MEHEKVLPTNAMAAQPEVGERQGEAGDRIRLQKNMEIVVTFFAPRREGSTGGGGGGSSNGAERLRPHFLVALAGLPAMLATLSWLSIAIPAKVKIYCKHDRHEKGEIATARV